jgi:hypothetical protein
MEISDRRYPELVASMADRQSRSDRVRLASRPARTQAPQVTTAIAANEVEYQSADLLTPPVNVAQQVKEILLVDPDAGSLRAARNALRHVATVEACSDFQAARGRLLAKPPDLLITNLRLQAYNGLHLVHLAAGTPTRCIAYAEYHDPVLAREVQAAGAFYERSKRLPHALAAYVHALLPSHDRRSPTELDRQQVLRGGRRCTDKFSAEVWQFL